MISKEEELRMKVLSEALISNPPNVDREIALVEAGEEILRFQNLHARPGDRLIVHVEIGQMPPPRVGKYLEAMRILPFFQSLRDEGIDTLFVPMREGQSAQFEVLSVSAADPKVEDEKPTNKPSASLREAIEASNG